MFHPSRLIALLLFVAMLVAVEWWLGWATLLAPWREQSLASVLGAVGLTFVTYGLRALRLYDYFRREMRGGFARCLKLTLQHNLLNNLLPMRSGELSFPLLMARYFDVPVVRSVPVLLWFRLLDLHTLIGLAVVAAAMLWLPPIQAALLGVCWMVLPWFAYRLAGRLRGHLASRSTRWAGRLTEALDALPTSHAAFFRAWGWTVVNWVVKIAVFAWVLALFLPVSTPLAWLGAIGGDLTSVLPVHGVAGAGTFEAGVVAALAPFGVTPAQALPAAINLHLFILASTLIGGLLSLPLPGRNLRARPSSGQ